MSASSRPARWSAARSKGPRGRAPRTARLLDGVLMSAAARGHRPRLQLEDLRTAAHRELLAEVARKFVEIRFKATGDSMLPSVWPGDLLTVRRQSFSEFQSGEIPCGRTTRQSMKSRFWGGWCALPGMDATSAWSLRGSGGSWRGFCSGRISRGGCFFDLRGGGI